MQTTELPMTQTKCVYQNPVGFKTEKGEQANV